MDYKQVLKNIYKPEIGSIWKAPNKIWTTGFARNKTPEGYHPSIVEKLRLDDVSIQLVPGTSKAYQQGSCVFKVKLGKTDRMTFFLLKLSMPYIIEDLLKLERGWNGINTLSSSQLKDFEWQIKICKG